MNFNDLLAQLDPDPKRAGKQFEPICQWYLQNDPSYAFKDVWLWKEWPDRWKQDEAGIDLVARTRDGELWAIQAKHYAGKIPKDEIHGFLSESARKNAAGKPLFAYRLLIGTPATTEPFSRHAQDLVAGSYIPVGVVDRAVLETAPLDWPSSPSDLRRRPLSPKQPRPYQNEAINDVVEGFRDADRGQLIMACGLGKTLIALFIADKLGAERSLVLLPSLSLLDQTMREWTASRTADFDYRLVCSDTTAGGEDAAMEHTSNLGHPPMTDPVKIAEFLRRPGRRVVFSTYQSSPEVAAAFRLGGLPAFDLAVADEAHRCAGPVASMFATILDGEKIPAQRRLFMTATPRIFTKRVLNAAVDDDLEYASMDDEKKFGTVFHRLAFRDAIHYKPDRLLTDYRVLVIGVDENHPTFRKWANNQNFVQRVQGVAENAGHLAPVITSEQLNHEIDLSTVDFDYIGQHKQEAMSGRLTGGVPLEPAKESGTGTVRDPEMVALDEVIAQINDLFSGDHPDSSVRNVVTHIKDRLEESETLQQQARNNSLAQFSASPDLQSEFVGAVIGAMESHSDLSSQIIDNPALKQKLLGELVPIIYRSLKVS